MVLQVTNEKARKILISQIIREQALERKNKFPQASSEFEISIIIRMRDPLFQKQCFLVLLRGSKAILFASRQFSQPGNKTRDNVSAILFPNLAMP